MKPVITCALFLFTAWHSFSQQVDLEDGLVAYYPFNGNANDYSGNNNHGTVHGADQAHDRFYNPGAAYFFDGQDDYIEIVPVSNVGQMQDFTISVWAKLKAYKPQYPPRTNSLDRQYIFDGHSASKTQKGYIYRDGFLLAYNLLPSHEGELLHGFRSGAKSYVSFASAPTVMEWHHLVYMRRGGKMYQYIDGQLVMSAQKKAKVLDMQHPWYVGTFAGNNPDYLYGSFNYNFHGVIDDLRIYFRALNETEILVLNDKIPSEPCFSEQKKPSRIQWKGFAFALLQHDVILFKIDPIAYLLTFQATLLAALIVVRIRRGSSSR